MARLTKRDLGGNPILNCDVCDEYCGLLPCRNQLIKLLAAYEEAEEQERLIILPCKVGDVLWDTENLTEIPSRHIVLGFDVLKSLSMVHLSGGQSLPICEIGKTVFLSREEAEAALGKGRDM